MLCATLMHMAENPAMSAEEGWEYVDGEDLKKRLKDTFASVSITSEPAFQKWRETAIPPFEYHNFTKTGYPAGKCMGDALSWMLLRGEEDPELFGHLVSLGLNPNLAVDGWGHTAAHLCARYGFSECLQLLKECRADFSVRTHHDCQTPREMALEIKENRKTALTMPLYANTGDQNSASSAAYKKCRDFDAVVEILEPNAGKGDSTGRSESWSPHDEVLAKLQICIERLLASTSFGKFMQQWIETKTNPPQHIPKSQQYSPEVKSMLKAAFQNHSCKQTEGQQRISVQRQRYFPESLPSLAKRKRFFGMQNLIRRGLFALEKDEFELKEDGKTAEQWAISHGREDVAAEISFFRLRAKDQESEAAVITVKNILEKSKLDLATTPDPLAFKDAIFGQEPLWTWGEHKNQAKFKEILKPFTTNVIRPHDEFQAVYEKFTMPIETEVDMKGNTVLHSGLGPHGSDDEDFLGTILALGVFPDQQNGATGMAPSHECVTHRRPRCLQLLLDCRADLDALTWMDGGSNLLILALAQLGQTFSERFGTGIGETQLIQQRRLLWVFEVYLLEALDRKDKSSGGKSLAQLAREGKFYAVQNLIRRPGFNKREELDCVRVNGLTAQQWAIEHGRVDIALEMEGWKDYAPQHVQKEMKNFGRFCRELGAQPVHSSQEPRPTTSEWMKRILFSSVTSVDDGGVVEETKLPIVQMAYEDDLEVYPGCMYHQLSRMLHLRPEFPSVMMQVFAAYCLENPKTIPAYLLLYAFRSELEMMRTLFQTIGHCLDHEARNSYGETALMLCVKKRFHRAVLLYILSAADRAGQFSHLQDLIDDQEPSKGFTVAHYCAALGAFDQLEGLFEFRDRYAEESGHRLLFNTTKDHMGRLPSELAQVHGRSEIASQLQLSLTTVVSSQEVNDDHGPLFQSMDQCLPLPGLPSIGAPSDQNNLKAITATGNNLKRASEEVLRYIRRELPRLLPNKGSTSDSLIVVPPKFPSECPYSHEDKRRGWDAEKKVYDRLTVMLEKFQRKHPDLTVALFHSLRYLRSTNVDGKADDSESLENQSDLNKEFEIDFVLLCYNGESGMFSAILLEVKGGNGVRGVLKNKNWRAVLQPVQHLVALKQQLRSELDSIKLCIAVAPDDEHTRIESGKGFNEVVQEGLKKLQRNIRIPDEVKQEITKIESSVLEPGSQFTGITPAILGNDEQLLAWLEEHLVPSKPSNPDSPKEFQSLLTWCLQKCLGVYVSETSQDMDNPDNLLLGLDEDQHQQQQHPQPTQKVIALLTLEQQKLLQLPTVGRKKPHVIIGASGTGKTFIAQHKLLLMHRQGLICPEKEAVYVCSSMNTALVAEMKRTFKAHPHIKVVEFDADTSGDLKQCVNSIVCKTNGMEKVVYTIFDQMEDIRFQEDMQRMEELFDTCEESHLEMTWMLLNPIGFWANPSHLQCPFLSTARTMGLCTGLDLIIRNTRTIARGFLGSKGSINHPPSVMLAPEPIGHEGRDIFYAVLEPSAACQFASDKEAAAAMAALVCNNLKLSHGIQPQSILVVHNEEGFLQELDKWLVRAFGRTKNSICSMAPILVQLTGLSVSGVDISKGEVEKAVAFIKAFGSDYGSDSWHKSDKIKSFLEAGKYCTSDVHLYRKLCQHPLLSIARGFLCRQITMAETGNNGVSLLKDFTDSLEQEKLITQGQMASQDQVPEKKSPLRIYLEKFEYLCLLPRAHVNGYEGDVVVSVEQSMSRHLYQLTRAKVMAVLASVNMAKEPLKEWFGSDVEDLFPDNKALFDRLSTLVQNN